MSGEAFQTVQGATSFSRTKKDARTKNGILKFCVLLKGNRLMKENMSCLEGVLLTAFDGVRPQISVERNKEKNGSSRHINQWCMSSMHTMPSPAFRVGKSRELESPCN